MRLVAEQPDWNVRSTLAIRPGRWIMRNGHVAEISHQKILKYGDNKSFPIWIGRCIYCNAPYTWNMNGTYAAVGKHQNDILRPT